jgi:hypothetical protein
LREELHPQGLEMVTVALDTGGPEAPVRGSTARRRRIQR